MDGNFKIIMECEYEYGWQIENDLNVNMNCVNKNIIVYCIL